MGPSLTVSIYKPNAGRMRIDKILGAYWSDSPTHLVKPWPVEEALRKKAMEWTLEIAQQ